MPHFVLEYSDNIMEEVDFRVLFRRLHDSLVRTGPFELSAIKSRAISYPNYLVADGDDANAFVHLTLSILSGRDRETKQAVGNRLIAFLKQEFARSFEALNCSLTVEIKEMEREEYFKVASGKLGSV